MRLNMRKTNKAKMLKLIVLIMIIAILLIATIYMIPIMKKINTPEGQIAFKEKIQNSGIIGVLILFGLELAQVVLAILPGEPIEILAGICFGTIWGTIFLIILIINSLMYIIFVNKKVKIRYLCLYLVTMILGLSSLKGFSNYLLCSIFPFAYYFRNKKFNIDYSIISKLCNIFIVVLIIISSLLIVLVSNVS